MDIKIDAPENQKLQLETLEIKEYEKENQKSQETSLKPQLETLSEEELQGVVGGTLNLVQDGTTSVALDTDLLSSESGLTSN